MVIIRKPVLKDVEEIRKISLSRCITSDSKERSGLIDYSVPTISKYSERILKGQFYVAEDTSLSKLVGFMDCFPNEILKEVFGNNHLINHIINIEKRPFAYSNTIALLRNYEGKGISSKLLRETLINLDKKYLSLWGAIVHKPKANEGSIKFSERKGFKFQQEFAMPKGSIFGIYRKSLG